MDYIRQLQEVGQEDVGFVGGKAATLGELARAGFPVPEGFVLTTAAFEAFRSNGGVPPAGTEEDILSVPLPNEIADVLQTSMERLGHHLLAVRSSAVAEDLADASFAGQYETVLGVEGADALANAVRRCWASSFSQRVDEYRKARGSGEPHSMAVLVQRMVPAEAAGVAFTANPVSGELSEILVSAVRGLGDRLVSGRASPDEWVIRDGKAVSRSSPESAIGADQAQAIADLAKRVEQYFGPPQDIEWAIAGGTLYLLQARPITALSEKAIAPIPIPVEPPLGFWQREASHSPLPLSPMQRSIFLSTYGTCFRKLFDEFGLLLETMEAREIGGWVYQRVVPLGGKDRRPPPAWVMALLIRLVPRMRARIRRCVEAVRSDKAGQYIERWFEEWKPSLVAGINELGNVNVAALSDEELDTHIARVAAFAIESVEIHFRTAAVGQMLTELAFACRDLLGWNDLQTLQLLNGLSDKSSEPARRLAVLALMARGRPAVRRLLEHASNATPNDLAEIDPEFAAAFNAYLYEFGRRALRYEVADPTIAEAPILVLGLIRDQIVRGYDPEAVAAQLAEKRTTLKKEVTAALSDRSTEDRHRFERSLARAARAYPVREDNEFYTVSAPLALIRYAALEVGRRLVERGCIAWRDDVFFLELEEARGALRQGSGQQDLVARRKAERAWVEAHPGPTSYGNPPGPPPSFPVLPPEARFMHEAQLWMYDRVFAPQQSQQTQAPGRTLKGIPASPGKYTGTVRVIMGETEFHRLRPGDVLVCPITSPVWSVLFPSVGAIVTDTGGILSHSAIIAREYRVPAIVATGNATQLLRDDQRVTVNGETGIVGVNQ